MSDITEEQFNAATDLFFQTHVRVWGFLFEKSRKTGGLSRVEAFADLVHRQAKQYSSNGGAYFCSCASDLAKDWNWDRSTVSNFLVRLKDLGVLSFESPGSQIWRGYRTLYKLQCYTISKNSSDNTSCIKSHRPMLLELEKI